MKNSLEKQFGKPAGKNRLEPVKKEGPTNPSVTLLIKLGSALVHFDEIRESQWFKEACAEKYDKPAGHVIKFDLGAVETVFDDEVRSWIKDMGPLLPLKRR